jgi:hypothetical protein
MLSYAVDSRSIPAVDALDPNAIRPQLGMYTFCFVLEMCVRVCVRVWSRVCGITGILIIATAVISDC